MLLQHGQDVEQSTTLVVVAHGDLCKRGIFCSAVHRVGEVDLTSLSELADHAESFLTDSGFSLLSASAAVVRSVDSRVSRKWRRPLLLLR